MTRQLSIVVPTYNRAPQLARLLHALERQSARGEFEVVAVDDGSADETASVLAISRGYPLRAIHQPNAGPAAARNAGVRAASREFVLFIDDDVIPSDDLVERHLAAQRARAGVLIGRMLAHSRRQPVWSAWESRVLEKQYAEMQTGAWPPTARQFFTANASVPRADLLAVGLFDPSFRRAEDVELAYRLDDANVPFAFEPNAVVYHDTPRTLAQWSRIPAQYGHYDVVMWRAGRHHILSNIADELSLRSRGVRLLARALVGRRSLMGAFKPCARAAIRALGVLPWRRPAFAACSVTFNLLYLDGVSQELGGRAAFWSALREHAGKHEWSPESVVA
jgi:glycosyltransferase involved in cell wall biosynthesis